MHNIRHGLYFPWFSVYNANLLTANTKSQLIILYKLLHKTAFIII